MKILKIQQQQKCVILVLFVFHSVLTCKFSFCQDLESAFNQIDKIQSHIYAQVEENESKMPESFEKLLKLSKNFKNYKKFGDKMLENCSKICEKIKHVSTKIER